MGLVNCMDIWSVFLFLFFPELNFCYFEATCLSDSGLDCFEMLILALKGLDFQGSQKLPFFRFLRLHTQSINPLKSVGLILAPLQLKDYFHCNIEPVQVHKSQEMEYWSVKDVSFPALSPCCCYAAVAVLQQRQQNGNCSVRYLQP